VQAGVDYAQIFSAHVELVKPNIHEAFLLSGVHVTDTMSATESPLFFKFFIIKCVVLVGIAIVLGWITLRGMPNLHVIKDYIDLLKTPFFWFHFFIAALVVPPFFTGPTILCALAVITGYFAYDQTRTLYLALKNRNHSFPTTIVS
jgi:hypothetical protein